MGTGLGPNENLMFSCKCDEPKETVIRNVYRLEFTPENLQTLWEKARKFRSMMGHEIPTFEHFLLFFMNPQKDGGYESRGLAARIDDFVGIFWLTDINYENEPFSASIHYTFFDRRHRGRVNLCREAIRYAVNLYGFERLWTKTPLYYSTPHNKSELAPVRLSVMDFVERIGFRKEGRLVNDMMYKGKKFDSILYALNKDEVLNESAFKAADLHYTGSMKWAPTSITAIK